MSTLCCGWKWLISPIGQTSFDLVLVYICFILEDFQSLKAFPNNNTDPSNNIKVSIYVQIIEWWEADIHGWYP